MDEPTITPRAAIEVFRAVALGCKTCGKVHQVRLNPDQPQMRTWADPDDGHAYYMPDVQDIKEWLLSDAVEADLIARAQDVGDVDG